MGLILFIKYHYSAYYLPSTVLNTYKYWLTESSLLASFYREKKLNMGSISDLRSRVQCVAGPELDPGQPRSNPQT